MTFETPWGLLLLGAVPAAALLLVPRLRRRERRPAAFLLVRGLVERLPPLSRSHLLRRRLRTAFFLAAIACAALAAGGPVLGAHGDPPRRAVLLLDHRSPWRDGKGRPAFWEAETHAAEAWTRSLRGDDRVLLVRTDTGVVGDGPLSPRAARSLLRRQLPSAFPADPGASAEEAAALEAALGADEVAVVTALPDLWRETLAGRPASWTIVPSPAPAAARNAALLDVEVRPDLLRLGRIALFWRAGLFGPAGGEPVEATLAVSCGGRPLVERRFRLLPGETHSEALPALDAGDGLLQIELGPADAFPDDNVFRAPLLERPEMPVLLVTEGNPPLESALRALPGVRLSISRRGDAGGDGAVRVYDGVAPPALAGGVLAIAPPLGLPGVGYRGEVTAPGKVERAEPHFLLEGVSFSGLLPRRVIDYDLPAGMDTLARAGGRPVLAAGTVPGGGRLALLAFDPRESGWVRDPSFPILVANLVAWLAEDAAGTRTSFRVGERLPLDLAAAVERIEGPGGVAQPRPPGGWSEFRFPRAGRWRIAGRNPGTSGEVYVNLLDAKASAVVAASAATAFPAAERPRRPWRLAAQDPLAAAALLLLLGELLVAPPRRAGRIG